MAVQHLGKLDPGRVDAIMRRIREDPTLRDQVISELVRHGAREFIERSFDLDERQSREVGLLANRSAEDFVERALIMALANDGSVRVVHKGHPTPNLDVGVEVSVDEHGVHVEVTLTC